MLLIARTTVALAVLSLALATANAAFARGGFGGSSRGMHVSSGGSSSFHTHSSGYGYGYGRGRGYGYGNGYWNGEEPNNGWGNGAAWGNGGGYAGRAGYTPSPVAYAPAPQLQVKNYTWPDSHPDDDTIELKAVPQLLDSKAQVKPAAPAPMIVSGHRDTAARIHAAYAPPQPPKSMSDPISELLKETNY